MSPWVTLKNGQKINIGEGASSSGQPGNQNRDAEGKFASGGGHREFSKESHFSQADKEMKEPWIGKLSSKEINAIGQYTGKDYQKINSDLRSGKESSNLVKTIDGALAKSPLSEPTVAYRGFASKELLSDFKNSVGKEFSDKAFVSTSIDKKVAEQFVFAQTSANPKGYGPSIHNAVLATIKLPAGTKAGYVGGGERELLVGRNHSFKITEAKIRSGRYYVTMELVPK